jgi:hypothetical protein
LFLGGQALDDRELLTFNDRHDWRALLEPRLGEATETWLVL